MGRKTKIPWTDSTFNVVWGCVRVSEECTNCYAADLAKRYGLDIWGPNAPRRTFGSAYWARPLDWNRAAERAGRRHRVFCSDMADLFEDHPTVEQERARLWPLIRQTPWLDWQLLTKRADRITACLPAGWGTGWPNVWLGVTVGHERSCWRADALRVIPAVVRFISAEPLLTALPGLNLAGINWVIVGGESGAAKVRRGMEADWARDLRDRCQREGVSFYFKQLSHRFPDRGDLDGERIRQFPLVSLPMVEQPAPCPAGPG